MLSPYCCRPGLKLSAVTSFLLAHCGGGQDKPGLLGPSAKTPRFYFFVRSAPRFCFHLDSKSHLDSQRNLRQLIVRLLSVRPLYFGSGDMKVRIRDDETAETKNEWGERCLLRMSLKRRRGRFVKFRRWIKP